MSGAISLGLPCRCNLPGRVSCGVHREGRPTVKATVKKMFWVGLIIGAFLTVIGGWIFLVWLFRNLW